MTAFLKKNVILGESVNNRLDVCAYLGYVEYQGEKSVQHGTSVGFLFRIISAQQIYGNGYNCSNFHSNERFRNWNRPYQRKRCYGNSRLTLQGRKKKITEVPSHTIHYGHIMTEKNGG